MIDLYALTSPNVQKIYIALEELGLPYQEHFVDVWNGDQFKPEFVRLNPNAKIPVIVDQDGPGGKPYTVFESGAILMYLADKTGKLLSKETAARYEAIQWLMIQVASVGPSFGNNFHFKRFAPAGNDYSTSRFQTEVRRIYSLLDSRLGQSKWLGGADYSIADIATFPWTRTHGAMEISLKDYPNVEKWFAEISGRPAVKKMMAKVEAIKSTRDTASDENKDRLFGRGRFARV